MDEQERYAKGMEVRRAVLGDAHVDKTLKKRSALNEEFQQLITRLSTRSGRSLCAEKARQLRAGPTVHR
jgi:hypothetical protein